MKIDDNGVVREMTAEEIAEMERRAAKVQMSILTDADKQEIASLVYAMMNN